MDSGETSAGTGQVGTDCPTLIAEPVTLNASRFLCIEINFTTADRISTSAERKLRQTSMALVRALWKNAGVAFRFAGLACQDFESGQSIGDRMGAFARDGINGRAHCFSGRFPQQ